MAFCFINYKKPPFGWRDAQDTGVDEISESSPSSRGRAGVHRTPALNRFDSLFFPKNKRPPFGWPFIFGAGYGSRTRLHGLGSRCITDIRILRTWWYYSRGNGKIQHLFVDEIFMAKGKRERGKHTLPGIQFAGVEFVKNDDSFIFRKIWVEFIRQM